MVESFYALLEQSTLSLHHFITALLEQSAPISSLLQFYITLLEQGEYGLWSFVCLGEHGGAGL